MKKYYFNHPFWMGFMIFIINMIAYVAPVRAETEVRQIAEDSSERMPLAKAIQYALSANPGVLKKQAQMHAMQQIPSQLAAFPEPQLKLNVANLPLDDFSLNQTPMTQLQIGISQLIPYPGKLQLRRQSAELEAHAATARVQETKTQLIHWVTAQWWQLLYLDKALVTVQRNHQLLQQLIDVAQTKYAVGQGLQQDVLLAQVELSRLLDSEYQLNANRRIGTAQFNTLLGRDVSISVVLPSQVSEQLPTLSSPERLIQLAEQHRAELQSSHYQVQAAQRRVALAKKDYYPDFQVGATYGWRDDLTDLVSLQFSMNLPIYTDKRQVPAHDQRTYEWQSQKYALEDLRNQMAEQITIKLAEFQRAQQQAKLYQRSIIPQASQTVDAMLAGYQVNKVDFLNLLRAQMTLLNYETQYWQAISTANQALAALNAVVGSEVTKSE